MPGLAIVTWADSLIHNGHTELTAGHGPRSTALHGAPAASGDELVINGVVGADLLRLPAGALRRGHLARRRVVLLGL